MAASNYMETVIGVAFDLMPKGEWLTRVRMQLQAKIDEEAAAATAAAAAAAPRRLSWF